MKKAGHRSTADLGKTPTATHDTRSTAASTRQPMSIRRPVRKPVPPTGGTAASDAAVQYPTLGDSVTIDVDRVPRMQQKDHHQWLRDHGLHTKLGIVQGSRVEGGIYMLLIETGSNSVWVDARCCDRTAPAPQPNVMPDERSSPERARKQRDGAYNLT